MSKINGQKATAYRTSLAIALKRDANLYSMLVPFVLFFLVFHYRALFGLLIAFKDYSLFKGIAASPWVGLDNFKALFGGPYFLRNLKNTFLISFYGLLVGFPAPIVLALLFNEVRGETFKRVCQTLTYLPHFVSSVIVAGIVTRFLSPSTGMVNNLLEAIGLERTHFLTKPEWFRAIYLTMGIWKEAGFGAIIYIAALASLDPQLYEAARIDGAGRLRQLTAVTLPGILPTIAIMLILRIGRLLEVGYEQIILLYQPATYATADVISTYVFRAGLMQGDYRLAAAAGLFDSIVAFLLVFLSNKASRKISDYGLW